jgi:WD40 repeat protein
MVWDLQSGEMVFEGATREPYYLEFLPDERRILFRDAIPNEEGANIGYQGELWNIFSKELELTFEGSQAVLTSNGKLVMTYDHDDASPIYRLLWDAETGKQLHVFRYDGRAVAFPAISPDGKMTLMCESRSVTSLIDTQTDKVLREFGNVGQPLSAHQAFSDDGRLMITVYGNTVYLWDISDLAAGVKDEAQVYDKQE